MEEALIFCRQSFQETKYNQLIDKFLLIEQEFHREFHQPDPRDILCHVLNLISEESNPLFRCERKQYVAVAALLNSCVFEIFQQVILKKIFLPPLETKNFAEKLRNFNSLFDRETYVDVAFELDCAIVGITSTSPDEVGLFPKVSTLFHDLSSHGVLMQLIKFAIECQSRLPDVWYYQVFYLKGLSQYSLHDMNEFKDLKILITNHVKSKCDWRIYYGCIQILAKIASHSNDADIRMASIDLLQSFISIKSNFSFFLTHWTIKNAYCRFALVRNIFYLADSDHEEVRHFAYTALNHLHVREKSLKDGDNTKNCILDLFEDQSSPIRSGRLACLHENSVVQGFSADEIFADPDHVDPEHVEIVIGDNSETKEGSTFSFVDDVTTFHERQAKATASLEDDLKEPLKGEDVSVGNIYLNILNQFEDVRVILTEELITSYQKLKDSKGLYKFMVDKLGSERVAEIDDYLFTIKDTYNIRSLATQLVKTPQDDSILSFLGRPAEFFRGKTLFLYDPDKRHSKFGEIQNCIKHTGQLIFYLSDSWRLVITHWAGNISAVCVVMKSIHSLDYHLSYNPQPFPHSLILKSSWDLLPSGEYDLQHIYKWNETSYTHRLSNRCDGSRYKFYMRDDSVEINVKRTTTWPHSSSTFSRSREYLKYCQVEYDVSEHLYIGNHNALQAIKIRDRLPDKAQIQRELFAKIESSRLALINELIHPANVVPFKQLLSLVVETGMSPLPDSLELRIILNKLGDFPNKLDHIKDLYSKLNDVTGDSSFDEGQFLLELILSSNYATLVPRENTVDLLDTMQLLNLARDNARLLEGKKTILFLGGTGAGKSTTVNYFTGVPLMETKNQFGHAVIEIDRSTAEKRLKGFDLSQQAVIGQSLGTSQTSVVKGHKIHFRSVDATLYLADFPGFDDTRGEKYDMATALSIDRVIRHSPTICAVFLVLPYNSFLLDRGNPVIHGCARLTELLPTAFKDSTIEQRQVRIIITKHSIYEGVETSFEEMLTKILSDEEATFQKNSEISSYIEQKILKNRINTWQALTKMYHNNCIEFIDVSDPIRAEEIILEYSNSVGIRKKFFQSALDGPKMQDLFRNSIEQATHTWATQILTPYLQDIPSKIAAFQTEYGDLDPKISAAEARNQKKFLDITNWSQLISKYQEVLEQLSTSTDLDFSTLNLDLLEASRISHLKKELEDEENRLSTLQHNLAQQKSKIDQHNASMEEIKSTKQKKQQAIKELSEGLHVEKLWERRWKSDQVITYHTLKDGALEKAFNQFRDTCSDDLIEGSERTVKASDYDGCFVHLVPIHRDYVLVPPHQDERAQFSRIGRTADGKYAATCEGKNFKLDLGRKSDESGTKLMYSFRTYWKSSRNQIRADPSYDASSLPYIVLSHTVPNEIKNAAKLTNLKSEVNVHDQEIKYIEGQLVAPKEEINRLETEITQATLRISDLKGKLSTEVAAERSIQLQQLISDLRQSITSGKEEIEAEKSLIESFRNLKILLQERIREWHTKKILYALLIKSNLRAARSLYDFCCELENGYLFAPANTGTFDGYKHFIRMIKQVTVEGLESMCEADLQAKFRIADAFIASDQLELPHCLKSPDKKYSGLVESISEYLQIQTAHVFDFLSAFVQAHMEELRLTFPNSEYQKILDNLQAGQEGSDPVEVHCLTQLLNRPIVQINESELSTTMQSIGADLSGDPIFLHIDKEGKYCCLTYPPEVRRQIEIFMAQLRSLGGSYTLLTGN